MFSERAQIEVPIRSEEIMKSILVRAALACLALALTAMPAMATNEPIPGVDIIVQKNPGGIVVKTQTGPTGQVQFKDLAPGEYVIEIDGKSLVAAMDKLTPPAPAKKSSRSSFSLGIGGFLGGGSSRSNEGRGPVGGERNSGRIGSIAVDPTDPNRVNNGGNSSGGVGLGVNIPIGGGSDSDAATRNGNLQITQFSIRRDGGSGGFSVSQGYCPNAAGQGMHIEFTVPESGSYTATIDWGDGSPN